MLTQTLAPYSTTPTIAQPVIGKGVDKRFGEAKALRVYQDVVEYLRAESWKAERLRPKAKYTAKDFTSAGLLMTPPLHDEWRSHALRE